MKLTDDYAAANIDAYKSRIDERYRLLTSVTRFVPDLLNLRQSFPWRNRQTSTQSQSQCDIFVLWKIPYFVRAGNRFLLNPSQLVNDETRFEHRIDTALGLAATQVGRFNTPFLILR